MEDTELLEALDARARRAVTALDAGLAGSEPAPLPIEPGRSRRSGWVPLLVAAALVVVAMVGIGLALDGQDDEQGTVADDRDVPVETDDGGITRLALPDPAALGYEVRAAFDGTSVAVDPASGQPGPPYTAHGPTGSDDPWERAIVTQTTPWDERVYGGELIDLGGVEGLYRTSGSSEQIVWQDGDTARALMTNALDRDALVAVAREAVAAGWSGDGPLPGHDVLHEGTYDQFGPVIEYGASVRSDWQGVAYGSTGDDDVVLGWRRGGPGLLGALHVFGEGAERIEVAGQQISISRSSIGAASHASWEPVEGTVVALATYGDIEAIVRQVVPALAPIDADAFAALVAAHPAAPEGPLMDAPSSQTDPGEGTVVASVELPERAGYTYRVEIIEQAPDALQLMQQVGDRSSESGSGGPLADLTTPQLQAGSYSEQGGTSTPLIVSGVLPAGVEPDLSTARFVDRSTGAEVAVLDFLTGTIPGSPNLLGLVLLDADPLEVRVDVTFQTAEGERTWRL